MEVEEGTGAGAGERSAAEAGDGGRAGGWPRAGAGAAAAAAVRTAAREAHPAAPAAGARVCALGRPAGAGRRDGAAARAPRARRPQPGLGGTGGYSARAHPLPLLLCSPPPPPPGPGSVQEMARDEVPSCFPVGTALPPPPGLLLARLPERLCPASRDSPRGAAGDPLTTALGGPFPCFIDFSTFYLILERGGWVGRGKGETHSVGPRSWLGGNRFSLPRPRPGPSPGRAGS